MSERFTEKLWIGVASYNSSFNMNGVNNWWRQDFGVVKGGQLSKFYLNLNSVVGTVTSITVELWSLTTGLALDTLLETNVVTTGLPTATGVWEIGGFTTTLADNSIYALVWKNTTPTPASNYISVRVNAGAFNTSMIVDRKMSATDGVPTWGSIGNSPNNWALEFSDGRVIGFIVKDQSSTTTVTNTRADGLSFIAPKNGLTIYAAYVDTVGYGTVTGSPHPACKILGYVNRVLVAESLPTPFNASTVNRVVGWFDTPLQAREGDEVCIMLVGVYLTGGSYRCPHIWRPTGSKFDSMYPFKRAKLVSRNMTTGVWTEDTAMVTTIAPILSVPDEITPTPPINRRHLAHVR